MHLARHRALPTSDTTLSPDRCCITETAPASELREEERAGCLPAVPEQRDGLGSVWNGLAPATWTLET